MSNTQTAPQDGKKPMSIPRRASICFALFTGVLFVALLISKFAILPRLTQVEVAGSVRDLPGLHEYQTRLQAEVTEQEQERNKLVLPIDNKQYLALQKQKQSQYDFIALKKELEDFVVHFGDSDTQVAHLHQIDFHASNNNAVVTGDIRNVGPRSMTVLAQFIQELKELDAVVSLQSPRFTREEDAAIGTYSPFTIHMQLR